MLFDWNQILPSDSHVIFSSFSIPRDYNEWDKDIVAIQLPNRYMIDVEWCHELKQYAITLSQYNYDNQIQQQTIKTEGDVVKLIQRWSSQLHV